MITRIYKKAKEIKNLVSINIEAFRFTKSTMKGMIENNPLMDVDEAFVRTSVLWIDHLKATGRSHLITNPQGEATLRRTVEKWDKQRSEAIHKAVGGMFIH
jgi:hypothetical protein